MRTLHDTRAALAAAVLAAVAGGCSLPLVEVGNPPRGPVREYETTASRAARARAEEARHRRFDEAEAAAYPAQPGPESGDPGRWGVVATGRYHRAGCEDLRDVPQASRLSYASSWEALDDNLSPCPKCRPGP